jgi:hypothetical protein
MSFFVEQIRDEGGDFPFPRRTDRYRWPGPSERSEAQFRAFAHEKLKSYYRKGTLKPQTADDREVIRLLDLNDRDIYRYTRYDLNVDLSRNQD